QTTILMTMPVETDAPALLFNDALHKTHYSARSIRRRMTNGIANANRFGATANRRGVQSAKCLRISSRRVFGHIHHRHTFANSKADGVFRELEEFFEGPIFREEAHR